MTRIVRNNLTGKYVNVDAILAESEEVDEAKHATIFNAAIDEMTDADVMQYVADGYGETRVDLEILPVKISVDIV